MTRQIYGYISAIYTLTGKMLVNPNNQRESDEMVSMDDIELITMAPDTRSPNRFKIRVKEGREHIEPWKSWLPNRITTADEVHRKMKEQLEREATQDSLGRRFDADVTLRDLLVDEPIKNPPHHSV